MSNSTKLLLVLLGGLLLGVLLSDYTGIGFLGWNDHRYGPHGMGYGRTYSGEPYDTDEHCWDSKLEVKDSSRR